MLPTSGSYSNRQGFQLASILISPGAPRLDRLGGSMSLARLVN
jgi:hypothetical protein